MRMHDWEPNQGPAPAHWPQKGRERAQPGMQYLRTRLRERQHDGPGVRLRHALAHAPAEAHGGHAVGDADEHAGPDGGDRGGQVRAGGALVAVGQRVVGQGLRVRAPARDQAAAVDQPEAAPRLQDGAASPGTLNRLQPSLPTAARLLQTLFMSRRFLHLHHLVLSLNVHAPDHHLERPSPTLRLL